MCVEGQAGLGMDLEIRLGYLYGSDLVFGKALGLVTLDLVTWSLGLLVSWDETVLGVLLPLLS